MIDQSVLAITAIVTVINFLLFSLPRFYFVCELAATYVVAIAMGSFISSFNSSEFFFSDFLHKLFREFRD